MNNIGKNAPRVIERRTEVTPPELIAGNNVRIEQVGDKMHIHVDHDKALRDEVVRLQKLLMMFSEKQIVMSDKLQEVSKKISDRCDVAVGDVSALRTQVAELAAKPARMVETRVVEKPGLVVHERRVEVKTSPVVWLLFALMAASNLWFWVK